MVTPARRCPWSAPTRDPQRELSGLAPGLHTFEARVRDRYGRTSKGVAHAFAIAAPWWRHPLAYLVYGLALAAIVTGSVRWRLLRLQRQNDRLNRLVMDRTSRGWRL